eukprot:15440844-Alexandrium_andersonii.AAC.1
MPAGLAHARACDRARARTAPTPVPTPAGPAPLRKRTGWGLSGCTTGVDSLKTDSNRVLRCW